jgi:ATP-dependent 26S proteasome regulatory subunit
LLVLLDGLEARGRVAMVGTGNRIEALDPALWQVLLNRKSMRGSHLRRIPR